MHGTMEARRQKPGVEKGSGGGCRCGGGGEGGGGGGELEKHVKG